MDIQDRVVVWEPKKNRLLNDLSPKKLFDVGWQYRELTKQFTMRFLTETYKGSLLGLLWVIIEPLVVLLVYTFVFSVIFQARWTQDTEINFALIMFAGIIVHNLLAQILINSSQVLSGNVSYVKKVVFPLEVLIFSTVGVALIHSLFSVALLLLALLVLTQSIPLTFMLLPLVFLPLLLFGMGLGFIFSALGIIINDVKHFLTIGLQMLFFMTPIVYPIEIVPEHLRWILYLNPMTWMVDAIRNILLFNQLIDFRSYIIIVTFSFIICLVGFGIFQRIKVILADYA